jgi:hypothetical protein
MKITRSELKSLIKETIVEEAAAPKEFVSITITNCPEEHTEALINIIKTDIANGDTVEVTNEGIVVTSYPNNDWIFADDLVNEFQYKPDFWSERLGSSLSDDYSEWLDENEDEEYDEDKDEAFYIDFEFSINENGNARSGEASDKLKAINSVLSTGVYNESDVTIKSRGKHVQVASSQEEFFGYNGEPSGAQLRRNPNLIGISAATFEALIK